MLTSPEVEIPDYMWNYLYAYPGHSKELWKFFLAKLTCKMLPYPHSKAKPFNLLAFYSTCSEVRPNVEKLCPCTSLRAISMQQLATIQKKAKSFGWQYEAQQFKVFCNQSDVWLSLQTTIHLEQWPHLKMGECHSSSLHHTFHWDSPRVCLVVTETNCPPNFSAIEPSLFFFRHSLNLINYK